MMEDTLEGLDEDPELEEEAEAEVDQVLFEITNGKLGVAGAAKELPVCAMLSLWIDLLITRHRHLMMSKRRPMIKKWRECRPSSIVFSVDRLL